MATEELTTINATTPDQIAAMSPAPATSLTAEQTALRSGETPTTVVTPKLATTDVNNAQTTLNEAQTGITDQATLAAKTEEQKLADAKAVPYGTDGYQALLDQGYTADQLAQPSDTDKALSAIDPLQQQLQTQQAQYESQQNQFLQENKEQYDKLTQSLDQAAQGTLPLTKSQQAQIDAMKKVYEDARRMQEQYNKNYEAGTEIQAIVSGKNRYAPRIAQGEFFAAQSAGVQKLATLDNQMVLATSQLEEGFRNDNLDAIKFAYGAYKDYANQRQDTINKMQEAAMAYTEKLIEAEKQAKADMAAAKQQEFENMMKSAEFSWTQKKDRFNMMMDSDKFSFDQKKFMSDTYFKEEELNLDKIKFQWDQSKFDMTMDQNERQFNADMAYKYGLMDKEEKKEYEAEQKIIKEKKTNLINSIPDYDNKMAEIDALINHSAMDSRVGPNILGLGTTRRFGPLAGSADMFGAGEGFAASVHQLTGGLTLQTLIDAKAKGATFGALSNEELQLLADSATQINDWEIKDKDGKGTGEWNIDEKRFREELKKIQDLSAKAKMLAEREIEQLGGDPEYELTETYNSSPEYRSQIEAIWEAYPELQDDPEAVLQIIKMDSGGFRSDQNTSIKGSLGDVTKKWESNAGSGTVSGGVGDPGGVSYGTYQLRTSNVNGFVQQSPYASQFKGLTPGTSAYTSKWKAIAQKDPQGFEKQQHAYIAKTHYQPQVAKIKSLTGVNVASLSPALQEAIWSTAIQHGGDTSHVANAIKKVGTRDEKALLKEIYNQRWNGGRNFASSSPAMRNGVQNRFFGANGELNTLLAMA